MQPTSSSPRAESDFPEENYESLRKSSSVEPAAVDIPYKPVAEPAWAKHRPTHAPKTARFERLSRWDKRPIKLQHIVTWAVVAAGAAGLAGPALLQHLPH